MLLLMGPLVVYLTWTKDYDTPMSGSLRKIIMGMGMHKIVKQMGKFDPKNETKIIMLEIWPTMTLN
jgi:hypothetical protein